MAVWRGEIDLEVAGVEHDAGGCVDRKGDAVDKRVRDANGHDAEGAEREAAAGQHLDEVSIVEEAVFVELALDIGECELGAVDRDVQLGKNPGQAADVILMAMGEDNGADQGAVFYEKADIGDDDVDAEELFLGEHEAGVDDDDVVTETEGEAVHAELAQPAERDNLQLVCSHEPSV